MLVTEVGQRGLSKGTGQCRCAGTAVFAAEVGSSTDSHICRGRLQVTKRTPDQVDAPSRDGAFVHGVVLEGCSWDDKMGVLEESRPKQLFTQMPVMLMKAVPAEKEPRDGVYQCPVYFTERRFREEVFTAQLKTKQPWTQWAAAGVALMLDVAPA